VRYQNCMNQIQMKMLNMSKQLKKLAKELRKYDYEVKLVKEPDYTFLSVTGYISATWAEVTTTILIAPEGGSGNLYYNLYTVVNLPIEPDRIQGLLMVEMLNNVYDGKFFYDKEGDLLYTTRLPVLPELGVHYIVSQLTLHMDVVILTSGIYNKVPV